MLFLAYYAPYTSERLCLYDGKQCFQLKQFHLNPNAPCIHFGRHLFGYITVGNNLTMWNFTRNFPPMGASGNWVTASENTFIKCRSINGSPLFYPLWQLLQIQHKRYWYSTVDFSLWHGSHMKQADTPGQRFLHSLHQFLANKAKAQNRCRRKGGGRKSIETKNPEILKELEKLLEPYTKGAPMNPLKWTGKSAIR